jgi:hypothetical protein
MSRNLQIGVGAFRILDDRARQIGQPGLTLWTKAGQTALMEHRREVVAAATAVREARETISRITARASKAEILSAIEEVNRSLSGALERYAMCGLLCLLIGTAATSSGDADDLARRGTSSRGGRRRRDDEVVLCDGETGDAGDDDLDEALFFAQAGKHPLAEVVA